MSKINFVPDDYIQQRESNRANWLYFVLLIAVLAGIALTFSFLKMRQKTVNDQLTALEASLNKAQEQIKLLDQLEIKGKAMMKTALITAELPDLIGKSVILACLTNNLPEGVSLTDLKISDKEVKIEADTKSKTQFQTAKSAASNESHWTSKIITSTNIDISGIAPSDIEVANYIATLGESFLIRNVGLIESAERNVKDVTYRQFKLKAALNRDVKLTKEEIDKIRKKGIKTI